MAAVTNDHRLSSLRHHYVIILQFWRSEVRHGAHWVPVRALQGWVLLGTLGESMYVAFPSVERHPHSLAHGPIFKSSSAAPSNLSVPPLPPLLHKEPCVYNGSSRIIQDNLLPPQPCLNPILKVLFPVKSHSHRSWGLRCEYLGVRTLIIVLATTLSQSSALPTLNLISQETQSTLLP